MKKNIGLYIAAAAFMALLLAIFYFMPVEAIGLLWE